jgi:tRNA (guanine-N7-)-methyltransferase
MDASDIAGVFAPGEVDRIYLNFSDPWPKARHAGRRLTSREFLARYDRVLAEDGTIEFKTDNRLLFDFSVSEVNVSSAFHMRGCTYDLHHDDTMNHGNIMTEYEEKFSSLGNPICKLVVGRNS